MSRQKANKGREEAVVTTSASSTKPPESWLCSTCARRCPYRKVAAGARCRRHVNVARLIKSVFAPGFAATWLGQEVEAQQDGNIYTGSLRLRVGDWMTMTGDDGQPWLVDDGALNGITVTCVEGPWPQYPLVIKGAPTLADVFKQCRGRRCEVSCRDGSSKFGVPTACETCVDLVVESPDNFLGCSLCVGRLRKDGTFASRPTADLSKVRLRRRVDIDLASCLIHPALSRGRKPRRREAEQ